MRLPALITIALTLTHLAVAWFGYNWILEQVTAGINIPVLVDSVQAPFEHLLVTSISYALIGLSIGLGAWICAHDSNKYYIRLVTILFFASILASSIWLLHLARELAALQEHLESAIGSSIAALTISDIKLHEVGLFASTILWTIVITIVIFNKLRAWVETRLVNEDSH
jgi:hypothetical protein